MPSELGQTNDPKALVPGEPSDLDQVELRFVTYAGYLHQAGDGLKIIDTEDGWSGTAAERFRDAFSGEPGRWLEAGDAFEEAATAVGRYRPTLAWAQGQAAVAIQLWEEGQALTASAHADHQKATEQARRQAPAGTPSVAVPFVDAGAAKRAAAQEILARARQQLDTVGNETAAIVERARDLAPEKPNFFQQVGEFFVEVGRGAVEGVVDLVEFAMMVHPNRLVTDPFGYAHDMTALSSALVHTVTHPIDVASASWDEFKNNPGRGIGQLLPGLVLGGGAGAAIKGAQKLGKLGKSAPKVGDGGAGRISSLDLRTPASLRGASPDEVRQMVPDNWIESPLRKGEGVRFLNPDRPGEAIMIEKGVPGARDPLHSGPYVKMSIDGRVERIPLEGNPVLKP